jgi:hypothetical protein
MKTILGMAAMMGLAAMAAGCTTYSGVSKADGQLYVSGGTTILFFQIPWIKRCDIDGNLLRCEELTEVPPQRAGGQGGAAGTAAPAAAPAPAPSPAPAPEPAAKPAAAPKK